jgi:hypothetical protein
MRRLLVPLIFGCCSIVAPFKAAASTHDWIRVQEGSREGRVLEIKRNSIKKYQGLVVFELRERTLVKSENSFTFYNKLFVVCSSGEVWDIASDLVFDASENPPNYAISPGSEGPTVPSQYKNAGKHPLIIESCKRPNGSAQEELPIIQGSEKLYLLLPQETRMIDGLVSIWMKDYPVKREPIFLPDGKPWIFDGEQRMSSTIAIKGEYSLAQWVFNCREGTLTIAAFYDYDEKGRVKNSHTIPRERWSLQPTVPGSVGRGIQDLACTLR